MHCNVREIHPLQFRVSSFGVKRHFVFRFKNPGIASDELQNSDGGVHLHVAGEWRHDVDVEAGHLVQAVEHHRVLPGQDRDGNWAVAERKVGNEHPNRRSEDLRAKLALNQAAPKLEVGGARRVCVMTEICMK